MTKLLAATAAVALLSCGAMLPTAAQAQTQKGCVEAQNTQKMPTQSNGQAVNADRTAPCEKVEGTGTTAGAMSGSPKMGTTGPAVNSPNATSGGGAGQSQ
jgi:hypothetical protein